MYLVITLRTLLRAEAESVSVVGGRTAGLFCKNSSLVLSTDMVRRASAVSITVRMTSTTKFNHTLERKKMPLRIPKGTSAGTIVTSNTGTRK